MFPWLDYITRRFRPRHAADQAVPFPTVFKNFKSILSRNNQTLELMADMGEKLGGGYIFDRQYIFSACEQVGDLVSKMVSDLGTLSRGDNSRLALAFNRIQHEIQEELAGRRIFPMVRPMLLLDDLMGDQSEEVGNKFACLGEIRNTLCLTTPDGFIITTKAFLDFMESNGLLKEIDQRLAAWDGKDEAYFNAMSVAVRQRIQNAVLSKNLHAYLDAMLDSLAARYQGRPLTFAVRSSAWGENSEHSFAGQYDSILNVPGGAIFEAYRQVVASAYAPESWHYRLQRGYKEHEIAMAVGCQVMVAAVASGAMYSYAPLPTHKDAMVINAAWGLGPAVVQGIAECDTYILERRPPYGLVFQEIGEKSRMLKALPDQGTHWQETPDHLRKAPCLNPDQLERLAQTAMIIERYYKRPQDLEWAFDESGQLFILQSRPLNLQAAGTEPRPAMEPILGNGEVIFSGKGAVVQQGVASGRVWLAPASDNLEDFPFGSILVARHTSPKYAKIMRKAHGIITDVGSVTGHMATLAREYRVPTVVDTGVATSLLQQGEEITMDAGQNVIYRGLVKELSRFELIQPDVFEDSYEYRLLKRLLKKISPLNLVDPHGDNFTPGKCRTYHDITRYIHEKAVEKLIHLSENYRSHHDKIPKRLIADLPLGLTVIDIEDGTDALPEDDSVTLQQIRSIPLRALLEGLAEPGMWGTEPVALDVGSFMSSLTRTMTTPMPGVKKRDRNLTVISKEYMNLHLKLGYHFNLVDAYISDTVNDNYLTFRFLGGVTDFIRRSRRARFIAHVLEQIDFRVDVHGDLVIGRLKKTTRERMRSKIKIVGALIGYTRQLDVVMSNDEQIARHFSYFMERITSLSEVPYDRIA